jgi:hypothetical protein
MLQAGAEGAGGGDNLDRYESLAGNSDRSFNAATRGDLRLRPVPGCSRLLPLHPDSDLCGRLRRAAARIADEASQVAARGG